MLNKFEISVNASSLRHSHWLHFQHIPSLWFSFLSSWTHSWLCLLSDSRFVAENLLLLVLLVFTSFFLYWVGTNTNHLLSGPSFLCHSFYKVRANGHWNIQWLNKLKQRWQQNCWSVASQPLWSLSVLIWSGFRLTKVAKHGSPFFCLHVAIREFLSTHL